MSCEQNHLKVRKLGIGFLGADSTGKTTLIRRLQDQFGESINFVTEVARSVIHNGYPLGKNASVESYVELSRQYQEKIFNCYQSNKLFISDRTSLDPLCYAIVNQSLPRPQVRSEFIDFLRTQWKIDSLNFHTYFYFPVEFPLSKDGIRVPDEEYRQKVDSTMQELIYSSGKKVVHITGNPEERAMQATKFVSKYVK